MNREQAKRLIVETFENPFDRERFEKFILNLLKTYNREKAIPPRSGIQGVKEKYLDFIESWERLGRYEPNNGEHIIDILIVRLKRETSLYRARTAQRNFVAEYLQGKLGTDSKKDAALVAFVPPNGEDWRFSLVKVDYKLVETPTGKLRGKEELTPAKRFSFLVGKNEKSHTAQSRFLPLLESNKYPTLEDLEEAFNVEVVTEEFFEAYKHALKEVLIKSLSKYDVPYQKKHSFAQLLLSRIMFLYFLQRKGWFKWKDYVQDKNYMKNLWLKYKDWREKNGKKDVFYSQWLSSLFFGAFNKKLQYLHPDLPEDIRESFSIMPFLNGGLFSRTELDELGFDVPDSVFEWLFEPDPNDLKKGFLETFNFTIDESLPVDVEVAVDPEMLGKVYESLIAEEERGEAGIFYTPRVEIDFMCRMSLVEYLANETKISKEKIIDFIFDPHNKVSSLSGDELIKIKEKLDKVKVVDPAVGSASFLVGMMNILVELHQEITRYLENREENLFALKQKIILENLYGVDVKDWAVMVGELRLWLSLIIETDEKYMDIYTKPLLPNLSFKIRQGDSLIQEIAGVHINLRSEMRYIPKPIRDKILQLVERKSKFFSGLISADLKELKEIENFEQEIFKEIIQSKIDEVKKTIQSYENQLRFLTSQRDLYGFERTDKEQVKKIEDLIKKEKTKLEDYSSLLSKIGQKTQKDYFLWELDFVEVFSQNGGFDIVIGNPPYVRQELIAPPLENKNQYSEEEWRKIKGEYKEKLIQLVKIVWNTKIDRKSDLYVYFYYQGLSLLRPGGIFCFINSNSWLDVGYGAGLQEFLLKNMRPIYIFDNLAKRSFKQADVNTVIVLIQRPENKLDDYTIKFVAFKKPFEDVSNAQVIKKIESANQPVFGDEDFRIYPKTKKELLQEGVEVPEEEGLVKFDPEHLPYIGNKWGGKYLRAPEIYFKILEKGKGKLVRLGDIAEVRRGFTTGANEFFYLKPVGKSVKEVVEIAEKNPDALIRVKNGAGWEGEIEARFLKPVIKSPKELKTIIVRLEDLNHLVFMCHEPKSKLAGTKALEYIKWGEKQGYQNRPTCKQRERWWDLEVIDFKIVYPSTHNPSWAIFLNADNFYMDKVFYGIHAKEPIELWAFLNSTLVYFQAEFYGYSLVGGGGSFITVDDLEKILILNLDISNKLKLVEKAKKISKRQYKEWTKELGFDPSKPIREQEPNPLPDRKALDDIIFDALGLTEEERKEVYWAVAELVKTRLEKARSV
ncbi:MAG: DNA methyltransferase [candidate division WOR-3 bacterium]